MIAFKSFPVLSWLFRSPSAESCFAVLDQERFQRLLYRERLRADRNGETFSLISMAARSKQHSDSLFPELIQVLRSRLRATDDVGHIEDNRLGVLLPDTPSSGAWTVVDHVTRLLPENTLAPICEVYTYPSFGDVDRPLRSRTAVKEVRKFTAGEKDARASGDTHREVRRMETLFAKPLPAWKRCLDVLGAMFGLAVLSPLLILIGIAVKLTSPGPVLFKQMRRGQGGRAFVLYKFRSMVNGADAMQRALRHRNEQDGPAFKIKLDPRITPLGKILRRTGLDEFPQLWNVLKGDMTLVGPRPLPCHESDASEAWQQRRLDAVPGLTCIWQSRGHEEVSFADWMRMDMRYLQEQRLSLDAVLIAKTALMVVKCKASG